MVTIIYVEKGRRKGRNEAYNRPPDYGDRRGERLTMGWRGKFVFMLIVYAAGFLTAIYCLVPAPEGTAGRTGQHGSLVKALKSDEFAKSVNSGMHKEIDLGKEAAQRAAQVIRERIDEAQAKSGG